MPCPGVVYEHSKPQYVDGFGVRLFPEGSFGQYTGSGYRGAGNRCLSRGSTFEGSSPSDPVVVNQNAVWDNAGGTSINVLNNRTSLPVGFQGGGYGTYCGAVTKNQGAIGAAKLLRIMSGDQLNFSINYTYSIAGGTNSNANGYNTLLTSLASMIAGSPGVVNPVEGTATALQTAQGLNPAVSTFFNTTWQELAPGGSVPEAYLHVLFFNDQFVFDNVNSMVYPITSGGLNAPGNIANSLVVPKDGYASCLFLVMKVILPYILINFFMLTDVRGPLLETNDYYPFGLTMAAVSGVAMKSPYAPNKYRYRREGAAESGVQ